MQKRVVAGVAIWALVAGSVFALSQSSAAIPQDLSTQSAPTQENAVPVTSQMAPAMTAGQEMHALDRHARFGMILYTGRFDQGSLAATHKELLPLAFDVKAVE